MNILEKEMIKILIDLKENYHVLAVKAEFEAEGTRLEEAMKLKNIVSCAGLDFIIKIGGCEALKDMYDAKTIAANAIVAPMIESEYALKKYLSCAKLVFSKEELEDIKLFINIETNTGVKNIQDIFNSSDMNELEGVVFGREDMCASLGLAKEHINSEQILQTAKKIAILSKKRNKKFIIGGGVSPQSVPFFKEIPEDILNKFETRKIVFDAQKALKHSNVEEGILKAIEFEFMWLKNKQNFYKTILTEDDKRLLTLKSRLGKN